MNSHHYTVVGGGAIGGTLAVHLAKAGSTVRIVDADATHVEAINRHGLRIETPEGTLAARLPAVTPGEGSEPLGAVLLAVKSHATQAAMDWIEPRLAEDGFVVSMQNGLNEDAIAARVGTSRTVAAFVDLFADVIGPGTVQDGGFGTIAIGEHAGGVSERVRRIADDLSHWGPAVVTDNVSGYLWSKLAFGAMLTATALQDEDMSALIDRHRLVMTRLVREVLAVALAQGVRLESFDAFEPEHYLPAADPQELAVSLDRLVTWLEGQTKKRSGIWRDLAVRHRRTEVPHQYADVVSLAEQHTLPVPVLNRLIGLISDLEDGRVRMGPELLDELRWPTASMTAR